MLAGQTDLRVTLPERVSPTAREFERAVHAGLARKQKSLPCRFLYDSIGSALFEEITKLDDYYPTRAETEILETYACEMVDGVYDNGALIEFGSGSSVKTEILLKHLSVDIDYVPIDVSEAALALADARLAKRFPLLNISPIIGDFARPLHLPVYLAYKQKIGFFPGSTIGNLAPSEAVKLLMQFRRVLGPSSRLIVGVDLKKPISRLVRAYNDGEGVTAAFNLNILGRINRELGASIDVASFRHSAIYNERLGRIEMHLVSTRDQEFKIRGRLFRMARGETIHTENSYKYTVDEFQDLARAATWAPQTIWKDPKGLFSVHELR